MTSDSASSLDFAVGRTQRRPIRHSFISIGRRRRAAALLGAVVTATLANGVVNAQEAKTCGDNPVMARGEASRFEWLARTKARANWRHRVRSTPDLGSSYSDWKIAANLEESCLVGPEGSVCTITAVPCRK